MCQSTRNPAETLVLNVPCVRKGQPAETEIVVRLSDEYPGKLPLLVILSDYRTTLGKYATHRCFEVEEIGSPDGRAWLLHRTAEAIAADPDHVERYGVEIVTPQDHRCECKGHERYGRCVHTTALLALLGTNQLGPHPLAEAPAESFPSEQQVNDDADPWAADEVITLTDAGIRATDPVGAMAVSPY